MKLNVKVVTGAKKKRIKKEGESIKVWLTKQPKDGEANEELVGFLAKYYDIPKTSIQVSKGAKSKNKVVEIIDQ